MNRASTRRGKSTPAILPSGRRRSRASAFPSGTAVIPDLGCVCPRICNVYGFAIPASNQNLRIARLVVPEAAPNPPSSGLSGIPADKIKDGIAGLSRFCTRVRNGKHRLLFLPEAPSDRAALLRALKDSGAVPFCLSPAELVLCGHYGKPLFPQGLPLAEEFAGLSDPILQRDIADLLEKLTAGRMLELAIYQKLIDILNRGWS